MKMTEMRMAKAGGTILSKKMGIASMAIALVTSRVQRSK
jgi:hypothetical protein